MAIPVKKKVKVLQAKYVKEADSILIIGECDEGRLRHQINSSCFTFGDKDRVAEMIKTAKLMEGKTIWMVFDPELEGKLKDNYSLKY
ncbi:MAG: hypothetical protein WC119_07550 [Synergistaceae bacterium]